MSAAVQRLDAQVKERERFYGAMDMKEELALAALEWNYQYNSVRTREIL